MGWRRFQTIRSQSKDATPNSNAYAGGSERTPSNSPSSSEVSSRKSTYSTNTQKADLTFTFPKWVGVARGVTMRIISNGEVNRHSSLIKSPNLTVQQNLVRELTLPFDKYHRASATSIPELDNNITALSMCPSSTIQALDQYADGLITSQTQIVSPTPTWDTTNLGHSTYENETYVPIFSGWASFCGAHTPPILVPRTHWDERVAGNRQARLDEMDYIMSTFATATSRKKQKEPVRTGTRSARSERQLSEPGLCPDMSCGHRARLDPSNMTPSGDKVA
jgi:hypothetical protein